MIPLATPRNGEIVNLSQIVQVKVHEAGRCHDCEILSGKQTVHIIGEQSACTVYFADGRSEIYDGDASKFLNIELHFALNAYRTFQQQVTSNIVGPDGNPPPLVM